VDNRDQDSADGSGGCALTLTQAERELLLRACQRYRAAVPTYLKSKEGERRLLDSLIEKLAAP
jgi:hypothetical protein